MKKVHILLLSLLALFAFNACSDDDFGLPTSEAPQWHVDLSEQYPLSMSAIVMLPEHLAAHASPDDQLAAFVGDECRGVGELVDVNHSPVYFVLIKGNGSEQAPIKFQYYSAKNSYIYSTPSFLTFEVDTRFGSADAPEVLPLKYAKF